MGFEDLIKAFSSGKELPKEVVEKAGLKEANTNKLVQAVERYRKQGESTDEAIRKAFTFGNWDGGIPADGTKYEYEHFLRKDLYKPELERESAAPEPQKKAA